MKISFKIAILSMFTLMCTPATTRPASIVLIGVPLIGGILCLTKVIHSLWTRHDYVENFVASPKQIRLYSATITIKQKKEIISAVTLTETDPEKMIDLIMETVMAHEPGSLVTIEPMVTLKAGDLYHLKPIVRRTKIPAKTKLNLCNKYRIVLYKFLYQRFMIPGTLPTPQYIQDAVNFSIGINYLL